MIFWILVIVIVILCISIGLSKLQYTGYLRVPFLYINAQNMPALYTNYTILSPKMPIFIHKKYSPLHDDAAASFHFCKTIHKFFGIPSFLYIYLYKQQLQNGCNKLQLFRLPPHNFRINTEYFVQYEYLSRNLRIKLHFMHNNTAASKKVNIHYTIFEYFIHNFNILLHSYTVFYFTKLDNYI